MAKTASKQARGSKSKKKLWYKIISPKLFGNNTIAETTSYESENLIGRPFEISLMTLTGEIKKQNTYVKFKVDEYKDEQGIANVTGYHVSPSSLKRLVRRDRNRVDDSFTTTSKDGKKVLVKPVYITRSRTYRSTLSDLKKAARELIVAKIKETDFDGVIESIITKRLQIEVSNHLKKIYPLRICEIKLIKHA